MQKIFPDCRRSDIGPHYIVEALAGFLEPVRPDHPDHGCSACGRVNYTKPVISAIEGMALGGGFELAMNSDIIVCGEGAELGLPEARIVLMPGGGTQNLPRLIGAPPAK